MDFIHKARKSFQIQTCLTVRSVLYECSAEALRQIVKNRSRQSIKKLYESTNTSTDAAQQQAIVEITQDDVDLAYSVANKVGQRWAENLSAESDDAARIVEFVMRNEKYLDLNYKDDFSKLDEIPEINGLSQNQNDDVGGSGSVELLSNRDTSDRDSTNCSSDGDDEDSNKIDSIHTNSASNAQEKAVEKVPSSLPYVSLYNVGQKDSCNLHTTAPNIHIHGSASDWHPMSALTPPTSTQLQSQATTSTSSIYIPNVYQMPLDKIQKCQEEQLYGQPAVKMPASTKSKIRDQISTIDKMAYDNQTMWKGDWDIIQNVVDKNKAKLRQQAMSNKRKHTDDQQGDDIIEVVPRSMLDHDDDEDDSDKDGNQTALQGKNDSEDEIIYVRDEDDENMQHIQINERWSQANPDISNKRRATEEQNVGARGLDKNIASTSNAAISITGRPPSDIDHVRWSYQDIKDDLGIDNQVCLEETMIHNNNDRKEYNVCQGALKVVGNVHLWEQMSANLWKGPMDELPKEDEVDNAASGKAVMKRRKAAHRLARKRRIYPNVELKMNASRDLSNVSSKIVWSEPDNPAGEQQLIAHINDKPQFMELDMGECTISLLLPQAGESQPTNHPSNKKKTYAFRSLELSLDFD